MVPMTVSSYTITQDRVNETKGPGQYQNGTLQAYAAMSHGVLWGELSHASPLAAAFKAMGHILLPTIPLSSTLSPQLSS